MNYLHTITFILISCGLLGAQPAKQTTGKYLGQVPPGMTPVVFAPGTVSLPDQYEYGSVFSKNGKEFYYAAIINSKPQIRCIRFENNAWTPPVTIIGSDQYEHNDPFLSPDETRLYFISDRPVDGRGAKKDFDIWYIERKSGSWSDIPVNVGPGVNTDRNEYYMSFTRDGNMYFSSNGGAASTAEKKVRHPVFQVFQSKISTFTETAEYH